MSSINVTNARKDLYRLIEKINESHEPVHVIGKNGAVVMVAEDDWKAVYSHALSDSSSPYHPKPTSCRLGTKALGMDAQRWGMWIICIKGKWK